MKILIILLSFSFNAMAQNSAAQQGIGMVEEMDRQEMKKKPSQNSAAQQGIGMVELMDQAEDQRLQNCVMAANKKEIRCDGGEKIFVHSSEASKNLRKLNKQIQENHSQLKPVK